MPLQDTPPHAPDDAIRAAAEAVRGRPRDPDGAAVLRGRRGAVRRPAGALAGLRAIDALLPAA